MPTTRKLYGTRLALLAWATVVVLGAGFALAAFHAPIEADQGFSQKIFYVHVPMAIVDAAAASSSAASTRSSICAAATRATTCAATPRSTSR